MPGLLMDTDECRAAHYKEAADSLESAIRSLSDVEREVGRIPEENARAERFGDVLELLDGHWHELRELEAEHSEQDVSTPDPDETARRRRQAEAERLPDDYEPTPMPELHRVGFEGFEQETVRLHFRKTDERNVKDRHGNRARQWIARVPDVRSRRHANYDWVNFDGESHDFAVQSGSVVAIGSKRHERCRRQVFYGVTEDGLEHLGAGDEGRAEAKAFLDNQEGD